MTRSANQERSPSWRSVLLSPVTVAAALAIALPTVAQDFVRVQNRDNIPAGGSNWNQQQSALGGLVTSDIATGGQTPASIVQALVGAGVTVSNVTYAGVNTCAGTFSGGTGIIGFEQGILLSTGNIASVVGPNNQLPSTSTDNAGPNDADLDALVGGSTFDRTVLEFDFECPTTNVISFQYVFTSEEYDEYVNSNFNDVFAFFLNGTNIALIPNTNTPVAINNVNCNNPYNPPTGVNCDVYTTNDCDSLNLGFPCNNIDTEMDGLTHLFSATGNINPGVNHIKLAIADRFDRVWDSNVFIRGESFTCEAPAPVFEPPSPCGQALTAYVGDAFSFTVSALATNGLPGQAVTLSQSGAPAGGTFTPPLPTGPAQPATSVFNWVPTIADLGNYNVQFIAIDQLQQTTVCDVTIQVVIPEPEGFCFGDPAGVPCPCANEGASGNGCANSDHPGGANLAATGVASLSNDTLVLTVTDQHAGALTLVWQGDTEIAPVANGDGLRCLEGLKRMYRVKNAHATTVAVPPGTGPDEAMSVSARSAFLGDPLSPGSVRGYYATYRDPAIFACPIPATINNTNALRIVWAP